MKWLTTTIGPGVGAILFAPIGTCMGFIAPELSWWHVLFSTVTSSAMGALLCWTHQAGKEKRFRRFVHIMATMIILMLLAALLVPAIMGKLSTKTKTEKAQFQKVAPPTAVSSSALF